MSVKPTVKKRLSLAFIIVAALVAAILITVLILSLVTISPFGGLPEYDNIVVYDLNSSYQLPVTDSAKLDAGVKKTDFRIMHAMLEGKFDYKYSFKTETVEENGKKVTRRYKCNGATIQAVSATSSKYMLLLEYDKVKSITVEGEKVSFDRIKVLIPDYQGEIGKIEFYPYIEDMITGEGKEDNEYYTTTPIVTYCYTYDLYQTIAQLVKEVK